jgi:hypothetical protein
MKELFPSIDEFYVGYQRSAPDNTSRFAKKMILWSFVLLTVVSAILVTNQRDFSTAEFEYQTTTTLSGLLVKSPVPHLRISLGKSLDGKELFQMILLVGSGKCGIDQELIHFPPQNLVTVKGNLIYGDGKALLQVNELGDVVVNKRFRAGSLENETIVNTNRISVTGEITDPKCYFGVMKPGEGKPHRSCAIRCISGGIPPVLKTNTSDYFLLVNENMQPINSDILSIVGDIVNLNGEMVEIDNWKILKINSREIKELALSLKQKKNLMATELEMTFCSR